MLIQNNLEFARGMLNELIGLHSMLRLVIRKKPGRSIENLEKFVWDHIEYDIKLLREDGAFLALRKQILISRH